MTKPCCGVDYVLSCLCWFTVSAVRLRRTEGRKITLITSQENPRMYIANPLSLSCDESSHEFYNILASASYSAQLIVIGIFHNKLNVILNISSSYSALRGIVMCVKSTKQHENSRRYNNM